MSKRPTPVVILIRSNDLDNDHSDAIGAALREQNHLKHIVIETVRSFRQAQAKYQALIARNPEWPVVVLPANDLAREFVCPVAGAAAFPSNLKPTAMIVDPDKDRTEAALDFHRRLGVDPTFSMTTANALDYFASTRNLLERFRFNLKNTTNTVLKLYACLHEQLDQVADEQLEQFKTLLEAIAKFVIILDSLLDAVAAFSLVKEALLAGDGDFHREYSTALDAYFSVQENFLDAAEVFRGVIGEVDRAFSKIDRIVENELQAFIRALVMTSSPMVRDCRPIRRSLSQFLDPRGIAIQRLPSFSDVIADAQDAHAFNCPPCGLVFVAADLDPDHPDDIAVRLVNRDDDDFEDDFADRAVRAICECEVTQGYPAAIKVCVGDFGDAHCAMMESGASFCAAIDGSPASVELFYALSPALFTYLTVQAEAGEGDDFDHAGLGTSAEGAARNASLAP